MAAVQTCHLDLWSDNLRRTTAGRAVRHRLRQRRARPTPAASWRWWSSSSGGATPLRQRRLYDAYLEAGGPGRITGRTDFALTVAQLHHIGHRHLRMWLAARDTEGRARSLAGIEEFLGEPFLLPDVDARWVRSPRLAPWGPSVTG